ncbi:pyruvate formate lyase family protein [uncultured Pseudoramibacter sp.]|uniref:glycyl radical protein n=1 Tax=uncultured Pseudoramibacter sp. TaxID=1623493 RepID=UPI0025F9F7C2|nr:pyruvate formate lyase family protein [uncultured Pseudoramibacter sp.]
MMAQRPVDRLDRETFFKKLGNTKLCIDRAVILTEAMKAHENEPMCIRRAHGFYALATQMPVVIEDWQLVVGNFSAEPFAINPLPDMCWRTIIDELDDFGTREGDKYIISDEDKKTLREILPWWDGKSVQDVVMNNLPKEAKDVIDAGVVSSGYITTGSGNFPPDYSRILDRGMLAIKEDIQARKNALDLSIPKNLDKRDYYEAALICCDGAMAFAQRYADKAAEMAETENDPIRKKELEKIAKTCSRALRYPVENIYEAIQAFWFAHVLVYYDVAGGAGISAGRLDQLFMPYYNTAESEEVRHYLECLWFNFNEMLYFLTSSSVKVWAGHPISQQPTIGGVLADGVTDASNELTKMMLKIDKDLAIPQPDVAIMYHENIDPEVMELACDDLPVTMKPKFFGYEAIKKQAINRGITNPADWPTIVDVGCIATGPTGKFWGNNNMGGFFNGGKVLELTLNNGVDPNTGKQVGLKTGDPRTFKTYDELYHAFEAQMKYLDKISIIITNVIEKAHRECNPQIYCSLLVDDCIARGKGPWEGGAIYNCPGVELVATGTIADSLAAIKKLVYEEERIDMDTLIAALKADFKGEYAPIQDMLINDAPKYGNDNDYVDNIAAQVVKLYCDDQSSYTNWRGTPYCPSIASVSAHVGLGEKVGALPDGRNACRPLSDGMSPTQGVCQNGPTAVIQSVAKIDQAITNDGNLLNMKFTASTMQNPQTRAAFITLLDTYFTKLDGFHMQFNVMDTKKLIDAQKHPEKYPELIVRVAAYTARFGQLPRELQNDIIERSINQFN